MSEITYQPTAWTATVPPGEYFLGDPCYAVPEADWDALLADAGYFNTKPVGTVRGIQVLAFNAFGYMNGRDHQQREYLVDSGLVGLVPSALFIADGVKCDREWLEKLGRIITFDRETTCTNTPDMLAFGHITIRPVPDTDN